MTQRRKPKGVLRGMRDSRGKKPKKRVPFHRKLLGWLGGAVLIAAMLSLVVLVGIRFLNPSFGERDEEATVAVEEISEEGDAAFISVKDGRLRLDLDEEQQKTIGVGTEVYVKYRYFAQSRSMRIDEWRVTGEADAGTPPPE